MKRIAALAVVSGLIAFVTINRGATQAPTAQTDTDGDGVPDLYETNGIELVYPDGTHQHLNLASSPSHKDVFVFYAWIAVPGGHTHKPVANTDKLADGSPIDSQPLGRVFDAFAKAPIHNPDNIDGITLHLIPVHQPEITETALLKLLGGLTGQGNDASYDWTAFNAIKKQLFPALPAEVAQAFHFCLFAHQLGGSSLALTSGIANGIPGNDLIVSLGSGENQTGTPDDQVGTFMHELGHDLGLHHGGGDDFNYKPNYPSVMNYLFQFVGTIRGGSVGVFDYSRIVVDLDEQTVNDARGITTNLAAASFGSAHLCSDDGSSQAMILSFNDPVRWEDCDDSPTLDKTFTFDINRDKAISILKGQDDWRGVFGTSTTPTELKPKDEPSSLSGLAQTLSMAPSLEAIRKSGKVQLKWTQIPLKRVQGYQVFRQTDNGPAQPLVITKRNTFEDSATPLKSALAYKVRPIIEVATAGPANVAMAASARSLPGRALFGGNTKQRVAYGKLSKAALVPPANN